MRLFKNMRLIAITSLYSIHLQAKYSTKYTTIHAMMYSISGVGTMGAQGGWRPHENCR